MSKKQCRILAMNIIAMTTEMPEDHLRDYQILSLLGIGQEEKTLIAESLEIELHVEKIDFALISNWETVGDVVGTAEELAA